MSTPAMFDGKVVLTTRHELPDGKIEFVIHGDTAPKRILFAKDWLGMLRIVETTGITIKEAIDFIKDQSDKLDNPTDWFYDPTYNPGPKEQTPVGYVDIPLLPEATHRMMDYVQIGVDASVFPRMLNSLDTDLLTDIPVVSYWRQPSPKALLSAFLFEVMHLQFGRKSFGRTEWRDIEDHVSWRYIPYQRGVHEDAPPIVDECLVLPFDHTTLLPCNGIEGRWSVRQPVAYRALTERIQQEDIRVRPNKLPDLGLHPRIRNHETQRPPGTTNIAKQRRTNAKFQPIHNYRS